MSNIISKILNILPKGLIEKIKRLAFWKAYFQYKLTGRAPYPQNIIIDPTNICVLSCPLCPTGSGKLKCQKSMMSFDLFKKIVDQIPTLRHISLFNWGESFLNTEIFEMIKHAKSKDILISIHSNLNLGKDEDFWRKVIQSGFDHLEISLDGASQETYEKYRRGGNFDLVIENIRKIVSVKEELGAEKPRVTWKFIVNRFNEQEIEKAKDMAGKLGVEFALGTIEVGDENPDVKFDGNIVERMSGWLPKEEKYRRGHYVGEYKKPLFDCSCDQLFTTLAVGPDGKVFPCCWLADEKNSFGDLSVESFDKIWNNKKYQHSRDLFITKKKDKIETICDGCRNFRKS